MVVIMYTCQYGSSNDLPDVLYGVKYDDELKFLMMIYLFISFIGLYVQTKVFTKLVVPLNPLTLLHSLQWGLIRKLYFSLSVSKKYIMLHNGQ